jgi:hypothetical protein
MGCIRVDKITEYLCDPLAKVLRDDDPYVRKTAAICVAKLYDISPSIVQVTRTRAFKLRPIALLPTHPGQSGSHTPIKSSQINRLALIHRLQVP